MAEDTGAVAEVTTTDSPPADTQEETAQVSASEGGITQPPENTPLHLQPRFKEVIGEKNAALEQLTSTKEELASLQEQIKSITQPEGQRADLPQGLSPEDTELYQRLYPIIEQQIFTKAQTAEQQRLAEEKRQQDELNAETTAREQEANEAVDKIKEEFSDDDSFAKFQEFVGTQVKRFPSMAANTPIGELANALFEDYKERGLFEPKASNIAKSSGGTGTTTPKPLNPKEDMATRANRAMKEKGMI